ncbi:MAG TPA: GNAT family N-acetyltransferase [Thermomicrobiales bacterium]|nr:GNAT family N-acetyltransferase [Thermomicrobiales bacterium]
MSEPPFTIEEIIIPATIDSADAGDFIATVEIRNAVEADIVGTDALAYAPVELLPRYLDQEFEPRKLFVARVDGKIVARAIYAWPIEPGDGERLADLAVEVLPAFRGRGIGTALADHVEGLALAAGRTTWQPWVTHRTPRDADDALLSPTGFGALSASDPGVRFLQRRGYRLEQVERISFLELPVSPGILAQHQQVAGAAAGSDYRIIRWSGSTPREWIDDLVLLRTRMSTDMPSAGLDIVEQAWTAERIMREDELQLTSGRERLSVAALHIPTGRLAGFSQLEVGSDRARPVMQQDTLVLSEHRGHRLGMVLKIANIQHLMEVNPRSTLLVTFNAEENRHMLSVNEAVGFRPVGAEGAWKKVATTA